MQLYKDNPHLLDLLWCLLGINICDDHYDYIHSYYTRTEMVLGNCKSNIADYDWWPGVFKYAMKAPESRLGESILETLIDVHPSICTARSSFFRAALNRGEIAVYYLLALHQSILSKPDPALFSILSKAAETYPNRRKRLIALLIQSDYTALATAAT